MTGVGLSWDMLLYSHITWSFIGNAGLQITQIANKQFDQKLSNCCSYSLVSLTLTLAYLSKISTEYILLAPNIVTVHRICGTKCFESAWKLSKWESLVSKMDWDRIPSSGPCGAVWTGSIGRQLVPWYFQLLSVRRPKVTPIGMCKKGNTQLRKKKLWANPCNALCTRVHSLWNTLSRTRNQWNTSMTLMRFPVEHRHSQEWTSSRIELLLEYYCRIVKWYPDVRVYQRGGCLAAQISTNYILYSLPNELRPISDTTNFQMCLRTHLFKLAFDIWLCNAPLVTGWRWLVYCHHGVSGAI